MVPPVLLSAVLFAGQVKIFGSLVIYFAFYVGLLILSVWDLVKSSGDLSPPVQGIHPS